jgi:peptide/nickel transport system permease protein
MAGAIRYVRNAMIDALSQDYIRTARSKGLSEKVVIYSHALRNAMIPISTIIVFTLFALFAGSAITESVFAYNGIGRLLLRALTGRDISVIISMNAIFALMNVVAVLVADILYGLVDPRIKLR